MIGNIRTPVAALLAAALLCPGCAFRRQAAGMAIEHNDFVAQTTNRQTVLNILRAREREPMHFTSLGTIGGKVQGQATLGLNSALNGDGGSLTRTDETVTNTGPGGTVNSVAAREILADALTRGATNWTPSASINVNTGTDFQVIPNATEEFYRGILGPLSPGIVIHYLRQSFPADLLTHLLVGRVEVYVRIREPGREPRMVLLGRIDNTPDDDDDSELFSDAVRCRQLGYKVTPVPASRLPVPLSSLSGIPIEVLARLKAVRAEDGTVSYELETPGRTDFGLTLAHPDDPDCGDLQGQLVEWLDEQARAGALSLRQPDAATTLESQIRSLGHDPRPLDVQLVTAPETEAGAAISQGVTGAGGASFSDSNYFDRLLPPGVEGDLVLEVTLRSVEGVLYYLGEYSRREPPRPLLQDELCPGQGYCMPIIRIRPASEIRAADRFVDVAYRGRVWAVPLAGARLDPRSGRSSQAISLVQQLLNLHRSSRDLPTTPLLRIQN